MSLVYWIFPLVLIEFLLKAMCFLYYVVLVVVYTIKLYIIAKTKTKSELKRFQNVSKV